MNNRNPPSTDKRFDIYQDERLNPETLEDDLPWWVVRDTTNSNHYVSEHNNPQDAQKLCNMLNEGANLASEVQAHLNTEFTSNDFEIDSAHDVISSAASMLNHYFPMVESI